jgi:hypothetical protein
VRRETASEIAFHLCGQNDSGRENVPMTRILFVDAAPLDNYNAQHLYQVLSDPDSR